MTSVTAMDLFSVVVAEKIIEDKQAGNLTYVGLVDGISMRKEGLNQVVPLQVSGHLLIPSSETKKQFEVAIFTRDLTGTLVDQSIWHPIVAELNVVPNQSTVRTRVRFQGMKLPSTFGEFRISMAWREANSENSSESQAFWYLNLIEAPAASEVKGD